ncbi:MAG: TonB-dependent receptor [Sphingobacteriales bacterium]|nr:TonB-dependent receptor [Sphingobacteriales bacterium]
MKSITRFYLLFIFLFCNYALLHAQGNQAIIAGNVSGNGSKPLVGAAVTVRNESTGFKASTLTNEKGDY